MFLLSLFLFKFIYHLEFCEVTLLKSDCNLQAVNFLRHLSNLHLQHWYFISTFIFSTTLSDQFKNSIAISWKQKQNRYTYTWPLNFLVLVQTLNKTWRDIIYFYGPKPPLSVKWCGHMWVNYQHSHIIGRDRILRNSFQNL